MENPVSARQGLLLAAVIEAYGETYAPVSSQWIARRKAVSVSSATIRNDFVVLEKSGLLTHPHTSAGRVPTAAGYQYYVDHQLGSYRLTSAERKSLQPAPGRPALGWLEPEADHRTYVKGVAKRLAEQCAGCAVVGFSQHDVYYTGLANLFTQPEFRDYQYSFFMSEVIDHLDEVMSRLFDEVALSGVLVLIGRHNPFGADCSSLIARFGHSAADGGIVGLLGPLRMNYPRNRALLEFAQQVMAS